MNFSNIKQLPYFKNYIFEHLETTGSTNDNLKNWIKSGNKFDKLQVADYQTKGRGQYNRKWEAAKDQCLMFSFTATFPPDGIFPPSMTAGLAMCQALNSLALKQNQSSEKKHISDLWLKWPNDIWHKSGKLCGILTESVYSNNLLKCVIGIGINITPLNNNLIKASCVCDFIPHATSEQLLNEFCSEWEKLIKASSEHQKKEWEIFARKSYDIEFNVKINDEEAFCGKPIGITLEGALQLADNSGIIRTIRAGTLFPKKINF